MYLNGSPVPTAVDLPYSSYAICWTGEPFRYTGRRFDQETGLYYYRARYYTPTLGRFLQTDPVGYEDDFNLYAYVGNDPLNKTDPTGMFESHWLLRAVVPGQVTYDNAMTAFENGDNAQGVALMGAMGGEQVMAVASGAVTLAGQATRTIGGAIGAKQALNTAVETAAANRATGGAVTGIASESGIVSATGASTRAGGAGKATNEVVQNTVDAVPLSDRSAYHGCCGEIDAMSNLANAGGELKGATMATGRAVGKAAGAIMEACSTCRWVADKLGVEIINPPIR